MVRIVILRLLESYFRHRWLYLLPMVICMAAGGAFVATAPPEYMASGKLYVEKESLLASLTATNTDGSWWYTGAQATTNEINELLGTDAFARSVIQKTDLETNMANGPLFVQETLTYLRNSVSVSPQGEKLVVFSTTSESAPLAYQMVLATMDAYVQWKLNTDYQESVVAQSFFEGLITPYSQQLDQARAALIDYLRAYPEPVRGERPPAELMELERLQTAVSRAEERVTSAINNEESARLALIQSESVTRQTYVVIDQPEQPTEAQFSLRAIARDLILFVAVGAFLSIAGVVAGALLDRSLRFPLDVRYGLSLPLLATVPVAVPVTAVEPVVAPSASARQAQVEGGSPSEPSRLQPQL